MNRCLLHVVEQVLKLLRSFAATEVVPDVYKVLVPILEQERQEFKALTRKAAIYLPNIYLAELYPSYRHFLIDENFKSDCQSEKLKDEDAINLFLATFLDGVSSFDENKTTQRVARDLSSQLLATHEMPDCPFED